MKVMGAAKLIGCSSVKVTDARSAALITKYFEMTGATSGRLYRPKEKYHMQDFDFWYDIFTARGITERQLSEAEEMIPSLLKSYIKMGAKVASFPAYDEDFNCIDFATILDRSHMDDKLARRFG